jgi:hypothetical protein
VSRGGRNDRTLNSRGHHRAGQHPSEVAEEIAVAFRDGQARKETGEDHVLPLQYELEGAPVHQVTLYYGDAIAQGGQPLRRTNEGGHLVSTVGRLAHDIRADAAGCAEHD